MASYVNTDFSHMSRQTKILRSHFVNDSVLLKNIGPGFSIFDSRSVTEFLAVIFAVAQLRDDGFKRADPNLFVQTITILSASLASQTNLSSGMSEFVTSKRQESYLAHTSCPFEESVTRELLVAPGPDNLSLIQPLREKVLCTSRRPCCSRPLLFWFSFSTAGSLGPSGVFGAGGYASPLDFSRHSTSGYRRDPIAIGGCLSLH